MLENLTNSDKGQGKGSDLGRPLVKLGFSLAKSSLFLGDETAESFCFDTAGNFTYDSNKTKACHQFSQRGINIAILLNLADGVPNANTVSVFVDGKRWSQPHAIPEKFKGKALYPTVTFRNTTLLLNFGPSLLKELPFIVRPVQDAAKDDLKVPLNGLTSTLSRIRTS